MEKIMFYKFFFIGMDKPVIMEAPNKQVAYNMLVQLSKKSQTNINISKLIDLRIESPLFGISTKKRNGVDMVWVGKEFTSDGWIEEDEYDRIEKLKTKNK